MQYKNILIGAAMAASVAFVTGAADEPIIKKPPVEITYTVRPGDTLWSIAAEYVDKNTYGSRDVREFKAGIEHLNPWLRTPERQYGGLILPGDEIKINYWTKD